MSTRFVIDEDSTLLEWAAAHRRLLLTHDVSTMTKFAQQRVASGLPMPGIFVVSQAVTIGTAVDEILLVAECSLEGEWEGQIRYLPL